MPRGGSPIQHRIIAIRACMLFVAALIWSKTLGHNLMSANVHERFPRTLYEWLKSDDKILFQAIADGESLLDVAESLGREHVSVIRRLDALELFCFEEHSEEWAEIMAMCLSGIPMSIAIEWCTSWA